MNNPPKTALVTIHVEANNLAFPLAAAQLKAALPEDLSRSTVIKNFTLNDSPPNMARKLLNKKYDAIGFSCYMWNARQVKETARILKKEDPSLKLFAGGPHITALPEFFQEGNLFDYLVLNEGEYALEEVLNSPPQEETQILQGERVNLETLASPFLSQTIDPAAYDGILWELSRGCPYNCAFCFEARSHGWVRRFPMARLREELKLFVEKGVKEIWVLDSTFNHNKEWCTSFLEMLVEEAPHIHFTFELRAERITPEQARLFSKLVVSLQIGLQSSNSKVMAKLNRPFRPQQFKKKIKILEQNYLVYGFDLIYGLPDDNIDSFRESLDFALALAPSNLDIFPLSLLPGTELDEKAEEWGLIHDNSYERLITGRPGFTNEDLEKAKELTTLCDFFYTKGLASIWFKTACDALELTPSVLLERFGIWLNQEGYDIEELIELDPAPLQKEFLKSCFTWRNRNDLYLPLESFILWHEALNQIMDGESELTVSLYFDP
ncbi:MAG: B12-binding domain-containing radical SAM protein, partial [Spirochaetales bacterium]|nr:B12-binding domain-containing radical SAM protein [Spirochaetales bacterium]